MTWQEFVRTHRNSLLAVDITVETIWLERLYVLFFIELASRRGYFARFTPESTRPVGDPTSPAANVDTSERAESVRFFIRGRVQKFTNRFDDVFRACLSIQSFAWLTSPKHSD